MMPDEHAGQARRALAAIVADHDLGPATLSDPARMANLVADLMPESSRESAALVAAARADVAGSLTGHAAQGMAAPVAIRIVAASLAADTGYAPYMAMWAVSEVAVALRPGVR